MNCCGLSSTGLNDINANNITCDNITLFEENIIMYIMYSS